MLLLLDAQEKARRKALEAQAPKNLPKAIGALTWILLAQEICAWSRFKNRRQVSSYTGLCPGVHQSGGSKRDGSINRYGNPRAVDRTGLATGALAAGLSAGQSLGRRDRPQRGLAQMRRGGRPPARRRFVATGHAANHGGKTPTDRAPGGGRLIQHRESFFPPKQK